MNGRFFRVPPQGGMGELPSTALTENGALAVNPPIGRPPRGGQIAPTQYPGVMQSTGENQSVWQFITFNAGVIPIKIQDYTFRKFFLIQNKSAAATLVVGFGWEPNAGNGLVIPAGFGYEPYNFPVNEIWVAALAGTANGLMIYGT